MVVVEPVVNEEKVRQLLAEQSESESLDYKELLDLRSKRDEVELAKDLGAMQMRGGYVLVGADSRGKLTGRLPREKADLFDEARVRSKMARYIPEPIDLLAASHTIEGNPIAIVYTGQHRDCLAIFKIDGIYQKDRGVDVPVFRKGDVFARHGSASERWTQEDVAHFRRCIASKAKEAWRREFSEDMAGLQSGRLGQQLAVGPAAGFTWRLDAESFTAAAIELIRSGDRIPIELLLDRVPAEAGNLPTDSGPEEFETLVDRTATLGALGLQLRQRWLLRDAVEALRRVYLDGHRDRPDRGLRPEQIWLSVLLRVYALGALAVRKQNWRAVRTLALQSPEPENQVAPYWRSWTRHGLTMAARSRMFTRNEDGRESSVSLLSLAHDAIRREPSLRPDATAEDETILNSLCQFDILVALVVISDTRSVTDSQYYPSFSWFFSSRTEPAIVRLLSDPAMRAEIFPLDDTSLAQALRSLNRLAQKESVRVAGWDGFRSDRIVSFLEGHPETEQPLSR